MNPTLSTHYAHARQDEIERRVLARRIADQWQPAPPGSLSDRMGKSLVHLGTRFMSDRQAAHRIEAQLQDRAA